MDGGQQPQGPNHAPSYLCINHIIQEYPSPSPSPSHLTLPFSFVWTQHLIPLILSPLSPSLSAHTQTIISTAMLRCKAFQFIMKTMGGFARLNDTDTTLVIKVKLQDHMEVIRFYAWLCTGVGNPLATDLIQLKVIDGFPNNPPTQLTYLTKQHCKSLCRHPQGLSSDDGALMTRTDVSMAAEIVSHIITDDAYVEVAHLNSTFTDSDHVDVLGENTGTHTTTPRPSLSCIFLKQCVEE